jgi:hypothetical protein
MPHTTSPVLKVTVVITKVTGKKVGITMSYGGTGITPTAGPVIKSVTPGQLADGKIVIGTLEFVLFFFSLCYIDFAIVFWMLSLSHRASSRSGRDDSHTAARPEREDADHPFHLMTSHICQARW